MKKIAFIGATGMLGKPVVPQLISEGFSLTLLARDVNKAKGIFPNQNVVYADLQNIDSLRSALNGHDVVYMNLHIDPSSSAKDFQAEREGVENVISVCKELKISRICYLSSLVKDYQGTDGFSWWAFDIKEDACKKIKNSGIPYLIFYPSSFMENFENGFRAGNAMQIPASGGAKMWWIAGADYGKIVALALKNVAESESRDIPVQGPESYTPEEAVRIYLQNYTAQKLKFRKPLPGFFAILQFIGIFSNKVRNLRSILFALHHYNEQFVSEKTWADFGKPTTTIAQYAKKQNS